MFWIFGCMNHLVCRYIALLLFSRVLDKTLFSSFIFVSFYFSTKILWSTLQLPERDNSHTYLQYGSVPDLNPAEGGIQLMTKMLNCTEPFIIILPLSRYKLNNVERDIKHQTYCTCFVGKVRNINISVLSGVLILYFHTYNALFHLSSSVILPCMLSACLNYFMFWYCLYLHASIVVLQLKIVLEDFLCFSSVVGSSRKLVLP